MLHHKCNELLPRHLATHRVCIQPSEGLADQPLGYVIWRKLLQLCYNQSRPLEVKELRRVNDLQCKRFSRLDQSISLETCTLSKATNGEAGVKYGCVCYVPQEPMKNATWGPELGGLEGIGFWDRCKTHLGPLDDHKLLDGEGLEDETKEHTDEDVLPHPQEYAVEDSNHQGLARVAVKGFPLHIPHLTRATCGICGRAIWLHQRLRRIKRYTR